MLELLGILTALAQVIVVTVVVLAIAERLGATRRPLDALAGIVRQDAVKLAWLVALVATAGSLYMSEVRHFIPCPLCWYQRIAMYPLVLLLGIAAWRGDRRIGVYAVPMSLLGAAIGAYHYQLERFPEQEAIACTSSVPCTTIWFEQLGYITIPMMAMSAFLLIATILILGGREHGQVRATEG